MDYVMYCTAKNKLYTILTDITRTPNKENVLANILFRVEELDDNNEDTKIVKELKDAYIYDAGLTDHQIKLCLKELCCFVKFCNTTQQILHLL